MRTVCWRSEEWGAPYSTTEGRERSWPCKCIRRQRACRRSDSSQGIYVPHKRSLVMLPLPWRMPSDCVGRMNWLPDVQEQQEHRCPARAPPAPYRRSLRGQQAQNMQTHEITFKRQLVEHYAPLQSQLASEETEGGATDFSPSICAISEASAWSTVGCMCPSSSAQMALASCSKHSSEVFGSSEWADQERLATLSTHGRNHNQN